MLHILYLRAIAPPYLRNILRHLSAQGQGQRLDTTTDAEDRYLAVVSQLRHEQFGIVTLSVDAMKQGGGFFTGPQGVEVAAAAEDEAVDTAQRVDDHMTVCLRGDDDGHTACLYHRVVIATAQLARQVFIIARDADNGHGRRLWEMGVDALQLPL